MDRETRLRNYLSEAEAAEQMAIQAMDPKSRAGWLKVAETYRELAKESWSTEVQQAITRE